MTASEQIRVLCARLNISMAELARRIGQSLQSLSGKMHRESFTISDLDVYKRQPLHTQNKEYSSTMPSRGHG